MILMKLNDAQASGSDLIQTGKEFVTSKLHRCGILVSD